MGRWSNCIVKRVTSSGNTFDKGASQFGTVSYMGKRVTTQVMHDYGFCSSVPDGGIGICVNPRGEEDDRASFFFHPKHRIKDLKPGETIVGNFVVSATMFFNEKGQGVITLPDNLIINCKNLIATVEDSTEITSPKIKLVGDVEIDGNAKITKNLDVAGELKNKGVDTGSTHKHEAGTLKDADGSKVSGDTNTPNK